MTPTSEQVHCLEGVDLSFRDAADLNGSLGGGFVCIEAYTVVKRARSVRLEDIETIIISYERRATREGWKPRGILQLGTLTLLRN